MSYVVTGYGWCVVGRRWAIIDDLPPHSTVNLLVDRLNSTQIRPEISEFYEQKWLTK